MLARRGERILASAAVVVLDRSLSTLTYATAGHPPPVLIDPDGTVTFLPFPIGTQLVLYTDGLVERRNRTFDEAIGEMITVLASHHTLDQPDQLIDLILDTLIGDGSHGDDIAVLIVKHVG